MPSGHLCALDDCVLELADPGVFCRQDGRRLSSMLPIQGIHMVASSPVRHDAATPMDPAGLAGVDITGYQPPWKALHEYALQGDIDPGTPQYQTLLSQVSHQSQSSQHQSHSTALTGLCSARSDNLSPMSYPVSQIRQ